MGRQRWEDNDGKTMGNDRETMGKQRTGWNCHEWTTLLPHAYAPLPPPSSPRSPQQELQLAESEAFQMQRRPKCQRLPFAPQACFFSFISFFFAN